MGDYRSSSVLAKAGCRPRAPPGWLLGCGDGPVKKPLFRSRDTGSLLAWLPDRAERRQIMIGSYQLLVKDAAQA